jgi:class 3 adenylate cyclase
VAKPGSVVIGQQTLDLVEGKFECRPLGSFSLKGKENEVLVYEVLAAASEPASSPASPSGEA